MEGRVGLRSTTRLLRVQISRESGPKWRGPAESPRIDETGATATSQGQTLQIVRKRMVTSPDTPVGTQDAEELGEEGCG